jgi:hypothetical protein
MAAVNAPIVKAAIVTVVLTGCAATAIGAITAASASPVMDATQHITAITIIFVAHVRVCPAVAVVV